MSEFAVLQTNFQNILKITVVALESCFQIEI